MRDYIILNNKNSNEIKGLLIQNLPPITKPRIRAEIEEIDGRDGDIVTPLGYGAYDKVFSIGLYGDFDINEVIKYFDSEGIVVFSNEPNKYYNYKILEQIDFEKLIRFRTADVMMHVQPFKYSTTEGKETEEMETKTASGSEITLPDTNNEKLQMEKLKGDTHQDTIDAEEGNENEDTNLAVNDVDPSKENYITLKGNTTQYNHDSVNMLPNDMATLSIYGITITKNDDGTYTINGTTTQDFNWAINDTALNLQANTNYFLSGCATGGDVETYCLYISTYADTGNGVLINSSRAINDQVRIFIASGQTFNNAIFKPMLIEGTEAIPFEPYGMKTPSPQYPSEVKVVTGNNVVSVSGKNLLDTSMYSLGSINDNTGQNEESSSVYRFDEYVEVTPNTIIYLLKHLCIYFYNENKGFISSNITGNLTITTPPNTKYIRFRIFATDFSTFNPNDYMVSYTQETHFEPYSKTDYPINLGTLELCKIGNYQDYIYKNNGNWYVHKEINKIVFDGSENFTIYSSNTSRVVFLINISGDIANYVDTTKAPNLICSHFVAVSQNKTWANGNISRYTANQKGIYFTTKADETIDTFKTWLSSNNVSVYYPLATPTEEEITDTTLIAQLDNLHTAELQETSYINSTPAKEYPYINLKYNVVTPAPSPDRASEINKVTGENVVSVQGENLLPYTEQTFNEEKNGVTFTGENGVYTISGVPTTNTRFLDYQLVNEYTIKDGDYIHFLNDKAYAYVTFGFTFTDGTTLAPAQSPVNRIYKFTSGYFGKKIRSIHMYVATTYDGGKITIKPMILNNVNTYTDFAPYSKTDYPISLGTLELCKIGDYQDYLYKNSGKWYVHKEIEKVILDGTEEAQSYKYGDNYRFTIIPNEYRNNIYYSGETLNSMNNRIETNYRYTIANPSIAITPALFCHTSGVLITMTPKYNLSTIDDIKNWLSNNNVTLYYVLATPTEEEITDTSLIAQLEALDNIYNQKGTTYIKTNPEANNMPLSLDVSYTESRPITITNSGNIYSKPIFTIYGEGNIGVYLNDIQLFNINLGSEEQITIDVAEMQAYNKETKALKNRLVTRNYDNFVLKVGENTISFSGIVKKFEIENYSRWI